MKKKLIDPYDKISSVYDILSEPSEKRFKDVGLELLNPLPGESILEIGCGTGTVLIKMAGLMNNKGAITGLDLSEGMINVCTKKLEKQDPPISIIRLIQGDARDLPLTPDSQDAIFMSFSLELFHSEDMDIVLKQCRTVLKKTGRMVIVSLSTQGRKGPLYPMYQWGQKKFPQWIDCRPIDVRGVLLQAGFKIEQGISLSMWGLPVDVVLVT